MIFLWMSGLARRLCSKVGLSMLYVLLLWTTAFFICATSPLLSTQFWRVGVSVCSGLRRWPRGARKIKRLRRPPLLACFGTIIFSQYKSRRQILGRVFRLLNGGLGGRYSILRSRTCTCLEPGPSLATWYYKELGFVAIGRRGLLKF